MLIITRRPVDNRGSRSALMAIIFAFLQLLTFSLTSVDGVLFVLLADDTVMMMLDYEFLATALYKIFSQKAPIELHVAFHVDDFEDIAEFESISSQIEEELAARLVDLCKSVNGSYFRAECFHEVSINMRVSFEVHITVTDGILTDRFYCSFNGYRP